MEKIFKKTILFLQVILVITFIIFEELIWESIAIPIYRYLQSLRILNKLEIFIRDSLNRYILLLLFLAIFIAVEAAGILAGVLIVGGYPLIGVGIYITKIPIAAFTFWLFKVSRDKLMSFGWFALSYEKLLKFIDWIKSLDAYKSTVEIWHKVKKYIKSIKERVLSDDERESTFIRGLRRIYRVFKKQN